MRATIMWTVILRRGYTDIMSRAFVDEDAGGQDATRYTLPDRTDPGYDLAAARALLRGADQGDTVGAEAATGYYWGDPALFSQVERLLLEAREDRDDRLEQLAERFLRGPVRPRPGTELDAALNPHRAEEQARAHGRNLDVLRQRGVRLFGDETDDELADLWSAVDRFESKVEARGGDTLTNAPDSAEPDNPAFVLPERRERESVATYVRRILAAAERLTRFEREPGSGA
jgi:hypothetical protein